MPKMKKSPQTTLKLSPQEVTAWQTALNSSFQPAPPGWHTPEKLTAVLRLPVGYLKNNGRRLVENGILERERFHYTRDDGTVTMIYHYRLKT